MFGEGQYQGRDTETQPEMVLLDIKLPKITGAEVLQRMRDDHRTFFVPVVLLTTSHDQVNEVKDYIGGLTSFLKEPMMPRDVECRLQEVREYWRTSRFSPLSL